MNIYVIYSFDSIINELDIFDLDKYESALEYYCKFGIVIYYH